MSISTDCTVFQTFAVFRAIDLQKIYNREEANIIATFLQVDDILFCNQYLQSACRKWKYLQALFQLVALNDAIPVFPQRFCT